MWRHIQRTNTNRSMTYSINENRVGFLRDALFLSGFECAYIQPEYCPVAMAERPHLFPCRTQQLSSSAPMVVGLKPRESRTSLSNENPHLRSSLNEGFLCYNIFQEKSKRQQKNLLANIGEGIRVCYSIGISRKK